MSASWGARDIGFVAAGGVATQLFPTTLPTTTSTAAWPPAATGLVRRPTAGKLENITVSTDGTNGGIFQIWDVCGLDRGASNNVNDQLTLTDAFINANGRKLWEIRLTGNAEQDYQLLMAIDHIEFYQGLAVRFIASAGLVTVTPMCEAGFMLNTQLA
jgi:hypothetical protein